MVSVHMKTAASGTLSSLFSLPKQSEVLGSRAAVPPFCAASMPNSPVLLLFLGNSSFASD